MAKPLELDLLARSLSGDWQSRIDLFKKFVWENPRVRRLGTSYQYLDDYLHDCFTNLLRTAHSLSPEENLNEWVLSVARWTALDRQRSRESKGSGDTRITRLCAGTEGDEPEGRGRLASYVPPRSGPQDSPLSRIAAIVGEPQFTLLSKRTIEGRTWEEAAVAAGKPLTAAGPMLAHTIDSLSRFFGAPPPLNVDLDPVFGGVVRDDAAVSHGDPLKPKGRILSMQLDPAFYIVTPDMRKLGLTVPAEVRSITLWEAARSSSPPGEALRDHLAQCHYCADVLRALLLMEQALRSDPHTAFRLCPGGFTLLNTEPETCQALDQHLAECELCREERERFSDGSDGTVAGASRADAERTGPGKRIAWAAGVVLILVAGYLAGNRYFKPAHDTSAPSLAPEAPLPVVNADPRFKGLAQAVDINDPRWQSTILPENWQKYFGLVSEIQHGQASAAELSVSGIAEKDPGLQLLYSELLYQLNGPSAGYQAALKAEAMPPRNSFRCWVTLQAAIILGDMKTINREVDHLSADPQYAEKARMQLARVKAAGAPGPPPAKPSL